MCTNDLDGQTTPTEDEIERMLDFDEYDDLDIRCINALRREGVRDMLALARLAVEDKGRLYRMNNIGKVSRYRIMSALRQFRRNVNAGRVLPFEPPEWAEPRSPWPRPPALGTDYG